MKTSTTFYWTQLNLAFYELGNIFFLGVKSQSGNNFINLMVNITFIQRLDQNLFHRNENLHMLNFVKELN